MENTRVIVHLTEAGATEAVSDHSMGQFILPGAGVATAPNGDASLVERADPAADDVAGWDRTALEVAP